MGDAVNLISLDKASEIIKTHGKLNVKDFKSDDIEKFQNLLALFQNCKTKHQGDYLIAIDEKSKKKDNHIY